MLYESERKVMETLWREGELTAGEIAKILALDTGWNRNTTYTVINKCIKKGYITRGEKNFICRAVLTRKQAVRDVLEEISEKYFDGSKVKIFNTLIDLSEKQDVKKMKKILKNN